MEPLRASFLLRSTYDPLPTPTNLKQWGIIDDDSYSTCNKARATLEHVLAACDSSLQKYTWRHNKVLKVLANITQTQCAAINTTPAKTEPNQIIKFHRRVNSLNQLLLGERNSPDCSKEPKGWQMLADLSESLHFPAHIAITPSGSTANPYLLFFILLFMSARTS